MIIERVGARVTMRAPLGARIGIGFFLFCMAGVIGWLVRTSGPAEGSGPPVVSVVLAVIAALAISLRSRLELSPDERVIRHAWGFGVMFARSEWPIAGTETIEIAREIIRRRKARRIVYRVRLAPAGGASRTLHSSQSYEDARRLAELMAQTMRLALVDVTTGTPQRREAGELDVPLAKRLGRVEKPSGPPPPGLTPEERGGVYIAIDLPSSRAAIAYSRVIRFILIVAAAIAVVIALQAREVPVAALVALGIAMTIAVTAVRVVTSSYAGPARVIADDAGDLIFETKGKRATIRRGELEELVLVSGEQARRASLWGPKLVARSDQTAVAFGHGLSDAQAAWVHQSLLARLSRGG